MPIMNYTTKVDVFATLGEIQGSSSNMVRRKSCRITTMTGISQHCPS